MHVFSRDVDLYDREAIAALNRNFVFASGILRGNGGGKQPAGEAKQNARKPSNL
jgi:hypothetical protein